MAHSLGLARALHAASLQQPSRAAVSRQPEGYPGRDEVVKYLEEYASTFELPVQLDSPVQTVTRVAGGFLLDLGTRTIEAQQVVVATGPFQTPKVPAFASISPPMSCRCTALATSVRATFPKEPSSSSEEATRASRSPKSCRQRTGFTWPLGLARPLPQRLLGRDLFWWLTKTGLIEKTVESRIGRRAQDRDTLIGSSPRGVKGRGVIVQSRVVGASDHALTFADGSQLGRRRRRGQPATAPSTAGSTFPSSTMTVAWSIDAA